MPNENQSLWKIAMFLGFVLFFSSILTQPWVFVGQPLPPNSTWGQMSSQIENFPTFVNPFDNNVQLMTVNTNPANAYNGAFGGGFGGHATYVVTTANATTRCGYSNYAGCVSDPNGIDQNDTFVGWRATWYTDILAFNITGGLEKSTLHTFLISVWCNTPRNETQQRAFDISVWAALPPPYNGFNTLTYGSEGSLFSGEQGLYYCPYPTASNPFGEVDVSLSVSHINGIGNPDPFYYTGDDSQVILKFNYPPVQTSNVTNSYGKNATFQISALRMQIVLTKGVPADTCNGAGFLENIGCQVVSFLSPVWKFLLFLGNGLYFIGQVLFWFVSMIGTFFNSLFALFGAQGAPPIISGFFGIFIVGLILYIAMSIMGKVRAAPV